MGLGRGNPATGRFTKLTRCRIRQTCMNNVVARFLDGRVLKGSSMDVDPTKPIFHLRKVDGKTEQLKLNDLKALFFVRSLDGNPERNDMRDAEQGDPRLLGSARITVHFGDEESISGLTNRYPPTRPFFFILPIDPQSNNIRILVNRAAVKQMDSLA